eukprot:gb/GECH01013220.1/.p1 GENE.gb/GECH01013220.1/~~gb/GECH01013220.1/.p1  ORF type:complete len:310 (+),score=60.79 gb/GECH01013220.1/:1-930(+)
MSPSSSSSSSSQEEEETQRLRTSPIPSSRSVMSCWRTTKEYLRGSLNVLNRLKFYLSFLCLIVIVVTLYIIFSKSIGVHILFIISLFLVVGLTCFRQILLLRLARRQERRGTAAWLRGGPLSLSRLHMRGERDSEERNETLRNINLRHLHLAVSDRDFDENDYEALLALDDNEDQQFYSGASRNDIERLPTFRIPSSTTKKDTSHQREQQTSQRDTNEDYSNPDDIGTESRERWNSEEIHVPIEQNNVQECDEELKERMLQQQCSICLDQYDEGDIVITLPCLHQYHRDCVVHWLEMKAICPICKSNVF